MIIQNFLFFRFKLVVVSHGPTSALYSLPALQAELEITKDERMKGITEDRELTEFGDVKVEACVTLVAPDCKFNASEFVKVLAAHHSFKRFSQMMLII